MEYRSLTLAKKILSMLDKLGATTEEKQAALGSALASAAVVGTARPKREREEPGEPIEDAPNDAPADDSKPAEAAPEPSTAV
jgi:hypothetical protein